MSPRQIERFFRTLSRELRERATVILTGAAAGAVWGHVRPSLDIDFAIWPLRRSAGRWKKIEEAIERASRLSGITVNFAEDIDRWGPISLLDYRRHARAFRRFGALEVKLLDPAYWSIGKISRYLDPDVQDLVGVLLRQRVSAARLVALWARALRESPRSVACSLFRKQAEHFLRTYGERIWGEDLDVEALLQRLDRQGASKSRRKTDR